MAMEFRQKFSMAKEKKVLDLIAQHASLCLKTSQKLQVAVENKINKKDANISELISEITKFEKEADEARTKVIEEIVKGTLPPLNREDFIRLAETMDRIADWSKSAARVLQLLEINKLPQKYFKICLDMVDEAKSSAESVKRIVEAMKDDFVLTMQLAKLIKSKEEMMDELFLQGLAALRETHIGASFLDLHLAIKFLEGLENLEDKCDETADIVKMIIVRSLR